VARHIRPSIDPAKVGQTSSRLASLARTALTGRAFAVSFGFASADLLFDLLSLDLVFLALRYQPGFGPLTVAYAAANSAHREPRRCWPSSATGSSTTGSRSSPAPSPISGSAAPRRAGKTKPATAQSDAPAT
jgi:hypothetical protein